ncbi:DEAD/DEAH box helicase [Candidatus Uhrbacteria bacterium CG_4_9_14_0_2_um_filter_41_50]|uniref:DEAD/DEAH box helicase n=1 Tax=Candidatus Uhrbacteria bacterium CG_4_9_14_0_2_um_filter_41_50 TaxID=1975031 RepID=A0A2M8EPN1_9BACT|nr:MAG: DEAD/DEAH box helicase [Candidatus Uhrbacteria bacterium CG_4_10_14_0_2_um_filter_41_21]PJC24705.1 MAG: DEAD/DEAH box helicase [Candidatus Uhrbacteria bacterium CG_4_9_14_0_2_um_filter_41_50]
MEREELQQVGFEGLGIVPGLLKRIAALGFKHPTPIQFKAIPIATSGEDVVGIAQTGSGKTLAFSIPMLQMVSKSDKKGLILLPTRELAVQVEETLRKVAGNSGLRTAIVIGGANIRPQIKQLRANPHIIVATPGRLIDHISQKNISLSRIGMLVLDEADRMLDMGFEPQLKQVLESVPDDRQTMLFSATMPDTITTIANKYMKKPLRIEVARPGTTADKIDQEVFIVPKDEKMDLLGRLLKEYHGKVLIFSRTKHGAGKITKALNKEGYKADEIHSNRSQNQRQKALKGFTAGRHRILVATDIASRGIDVDDIELVLNFDLPEQIEDYVHRIGRTARAGKSGKAISFAAPDQKNDIAQIQKLINVILPIKAPNGKQLESIKASIGGGRSSSRSRQRPGGRGRSGGGRRGNGRSKRRY